MRHKKLVSIGSSLVLLLLLLPGLDQWWSRNEAHLYLFRTSAFSPYICLIEQDLCEGNGTSTSRLSVWRLHEGTNRELLLQEETQSGGSRPTTITIPSNRAPLRVLAQGSLALQDKSREEAITIWKREPNLALYLAALAGQVDKPERAVEIYGLSLAVTPSVPAYLRQGELLFQLDQYREARDALLSGAALLESVPVQVRQRYEPSVFLWLGHTYRRLNELQLARSSYQRALEFDTEWVGAILGLAEVSLAEGDLQTAGQLLERLVVLEPSSPVPHHRLAQLYVDQGDLAAARGAASQLTSNFPDYHAGWQLLGYVAFQQRDYASSLAAYRRYLQFRPDDLGAEKRVKELEKLLNGN